MLKQIICLCGILLSSISLYCQDIHDFDYIRIPLKNSVVIGDILTLKPQSWDKLITIDEHPGIKKELTASVKDSLLIEINRISQEYGKDSLRTPDIFYIFKPYFDWLRYIDPHYRVQASYIASSHDYKNQKELKKAIKENVSYLPFDLICINDTLIVNNSIDDLFKKGDIIVSINGDDMKDVLKYNYSDRLTNPTILLANYFQHGFTDQFSVRILRDGHESTIKTQGKKSYHSVRVALAQMHATEKNLHVYGNIGYIPIPDFFSYNSRLIKIIRKAIEGYKKEGINDIILDLRNNPGGSGDRFDELLSIFIDRPEVPYLKSSKIMLSKKILAEYKRQVSEIGQYLEIDGEDLVRTIPLDKKRYISGIKYYILMNEGTGSIAASFCNIMQFNSAAILMGEALLHNALSYGEGIPVSDRYPNAAIPAIFKESRISTTFFDEYTKAVDNILTPDYPISANASEYADGQDAILYKAIEYINGKN